MSSSRIEAIVQEILALPLVEQSRLRAALEQIWPEPAIAPKDELERRLLEKGILDQIPSPNLESNSGGGFKPISIQGKPISETIIEERQ